MRGLDDTDHRIAAFAAAHHGVVSFAELRLLGLGEDAIHHRLVTGRLHRRHKGVYAVGHPLLSLRGRWRAAVLACGEGAVLSHWDAAGLWDVRAPRDGRIHVTRSSTSGRAPDPERIHLHRVGTFRAWQSTLIDGIPTTTVARTLLDLAPKLSTAAIEEVIGRAERLKAFDLVAVRRCLHEHPRQHGAPKLRRLLDAMEGVGAADLRSILEVKFLQLCSDHDIPRPEVNVRVAGFMVDFLWRDARLIVETDGYAFHSSRAAFERDRERDQRLTLAGFTVLRFTYNQVTRTPAQVAARLMRVV